MYGFSVALGVVISVFTADDPNEVIASVRGGMHSAATSPDGKRIAICCPNDAVKVIEIASRQQSTIVSTVPAEAMAISGNGQLLAVGDETGLVTVWNLAEKVKLKEWQEGNKPIYALCFADSETLVVSTVAGLLQARSIKDGTVRTIRDDSDTATDIAVFAGSKTVAATMYQGGPIFWRGGLSASPQTIELTKLQDRRHRCLSFSPDGDTVAVAGRLSVQIFSVSSGKQLASSELFRIQGELPNIVSTNPEDIAISPDGRVIAVAVRKVTQTPIRPYFDGEILLLDAKTLKTLHVLHGHRGSVMLVAFAAEPDKLITASHDGTVRLWDWKKAIAEPDRD